MTKKIISYLVILFLISGKLYATDTFELDSKSIDAEFMQLNKVEKMIESENFITNLDFISENENNLKLAKIDTKSNALIENNSNLPFNLPPVFWGCCMSIFGVLLVATLTNEKIATEKAIYGCIASTIVLLILNVLLSNPGTY